ncbi:unnamed protein product [Brassica oleracea var. botrytis]|uniref:Uncharacterized protein n=3 Tax=Brassica TaxID=3705 RepID=A0A0D3CER5_BRAOL|nr:hypothetical protein HID58_066249 [Brassica napus]CAF1928826.1 unnamed protein product [Brassica napus]VDD44082.1 unnamed protein product [Brassica oleracea]
MAASSSSKSGHEIPEKEIEEDIRPSSGGFPTERQASLNHIHLTSSNLASFLFYYSSETHIDNVLFCTLRQKQRVENRGTFGRDSYTRTLFCSVITKLFFC